MIKRKTYTFQGNIYSEIPKEVVEKLDLKSGDELLFEISDVVKIKTLKGNTFLNAQEKVALAKLNDINHIERTQKRVDAEFDDKMIKDLIAKKVLFRYEKDGKQMIGIDRKYADFKVSSGILGELDVYGFMILEPVRIRELTYALKNSKRSGDVIGIRGFDRKFYVILKAKFEQFRDKVLAEVKKEKDLSEISKNLKTNDAFCKTVLEILKEQGEVIEKSKGVYHAV